MSFDKNSSRGMDDGYANFAKELLEAIIDRQDISADVIFQEISDYNSGLIIGRGKCASTLRDLFQIGFFEEDDCAI